MDERMLKFKNGDHVRIINYGHFYWAHKEFYNSLKLTFPVIRQIGDVLHLDMMPELIGRTGVIKQASNTQNIPTYSIEGIKEKHAWYHENQLELVTEQVVEDSTLPQVPCFLAPADGTMIRQ